MTLQSYVDEIKNMLSRDVNQLDTRLIIHWINTQRALWCKNEFNKGRIIDDYLKQTIKGLELKVVDESEVPFIRTKDRILRTLLQIPRTINRHNKDTITDVRNSKILSERYNYVTKEQAIYAGSGKLNQRDVFVFRYNDYLYIKLNKANPKLNLLTHISVEGVFEDPTEVVQYFEQYDSPGFNALDMDYPLPMSIWEYMKQQILSQGTLNFQAKEYEKRENN